MTTWSITSHVPCTRPGMIKEVWFDSADGLLDGISIRWIGDNLGCGGDDITVTVICALGKGYLTLEETLRRIGQFEEYGRARILSALPIQFEMPEVAIEGSSRGGVK